MTGRPGSQGPSAATWCERNGHDFEPHGEDDVTRCTVCGADPPVALGHGPTIAALFVEKDGDPPAASGCHTEAKKGLIQVEASNVCDRCGYAHGVKRILVMVDGRAVLEQKLCAEHLDAALAAIKGQVTA